MPGEGGGDALLSGGTAALIGAAVTTIGGFLLNVYVTRNRLKTEDRKDLASRYQDLLEKQRTEYQGILDRQSERMEQLSGDLERHKTAYDADVRRQNESNLRCLVENSSLRGELRLLQVSINQLRGGLNPLGATESWVDVVIVADESGRIVLANPAVSLLFHWTDKELIGRPLTQLIPERFRPAHEAAFREALASDRPPNPAEVRALWGLSREGAEIPIEVQLSGWKTPAGRWQFGAAIRRRFEGIDDLSPPAPPAVPSQSPVPSPVPSPSPSPVPAPS